jgi:bacterioferritin-associated ferredoxin
VLVCLCHPLSDRELDKLVDDGADTVEEIGRRCGAGTGCGACLDELAEAVQRGAEQSGGVDAGGRSLCDRLATGAVSGGRLRCSVSLLSVRSRPSAG